MSELPKSSSQIEDIHINYQEPLDMYDGTAYVTDAIPRSDDTAFEVPLLISPGLLNSSEKLLPVAEEFARKGRRAIAVEHARHGVGLRGTEARESTKGFGKTEVSKAQTLHKIVESKGLAQVDLLGYCEGAVNGAIFALEHPSEVRNFVLLNPAGMGNDRFLRVANVFISKSLRDIVKGLGHLTKTDTEIRTKSKSNLVWDRILGLPTLYQLSRSRIDSRLTELMAQGANIGVMQSYRDSLYPYDMVARHVPGAVTHATLANRTLGHAALLTSTHSTVGAITQMLDSMEK